MIPRARGNAARLIEESQGYKERVIASAEGDASRFSQILEEYSKAPNVTRERLYLDMMQQVLSNTSKIMVDQQSGSNLLYLPLDKLIGMGGSGGIPPAAQAQSPVVQEIMPDTSNMRARETFRGREREVR